MESLNSQGSSFKRVGVKILLIIIGLIIGIAVSLLYIQKFGIPFVKVAQTVSQIEEAKLIADTVAQVGKLIILPRNEQPVLATITDASALIKEQPFYSGSKNGDVVLVYQKALKAIVYSPERNIIVNVGPVSIQSPALDEAKAKDTATDTEE